MVTQVASLCGIMIIVCYLFRQKELYALGEMKPEFYSSKYTL